MLKEWHPEGWTKTILHKISKDFGRGKSKHRPRDDPILYGGKYPFIQTGDVKVSQGPITRYSQTYNELGLSQSKLWPEETMCITIAANIAETGILTFPACFPDSIIGFVADKNKCNVFFVEYLFRYFKYYIQSEYVGTGTAQDNINLGIFEQLEFPIPTLSIQNKIVKILKSIDDLILNLKQINEKLEQTAQVVFKSWFIDFDGQTEFEDSELGKIPKGWHVIDLKNVLSLLKDGSHNPPKRVDSGIRFIAGATDVKHFVIDFSKCTFITQKDYEEIHKTWQIQPDDVLLTIVGTIGNVAIVNQNDLPFSLQRSLAVLRPNDKIDFIFLYCLLNSLKFEQFLYSNLNPTGQPGIYLGMLGGFKFVLPPKKSIEKFFNMSQKIITSIQKNYSNIDCLTKIRDILLPKLMSGEIRV